MSPICSARPCVGSACDVERRGPVYMRRALDEEKGETVANIGLVAGKERHRRRLAFR